MARAIKNLRLLLAGMTPRKARGEYYIATVPHYAYEAALAAHALGVFREEEGMTLFLEKKAVGAISKIPRAQVSGPYSLITLTVYSDLSAVGFIAAVSRALAERGISVNAVSAFNHDHLLIPAGDAKRALKMLQRLSRDAKGTGAGRP